MIFRNFSEVYIVNLLYEGHYGRDRRNRKQAKIFIYMTDETLSVWFPGPVASRLDYYTYSIMANVQLEHNQLPTANQLLMIDFK